MSDGPSEVEIYGRPAVVEKRLPMTSVVRWQDNGTQGFVLTALIEAVEDADADTDAMETQT